MIPGLTEMEVSAMENATRVLERHSSDDRPKLRVVRPERSVPRSGTCRFCDILANSEYDPALSQKGVAAVFPTMQPHSPGALLVVPWKHVADAAEDAEVTGLTAAHAGRVIAFQRAAGDYPAANLITSVGREAWQGIFHLHFHIIPRGADDNLCPSWPWCCGPQWETGGRS